MNNLIDLALSTKGAKDPSLKEKGAGMVSMMCQLD